MLSDKVNLTYKDAPEAYEKYGFAYCFVRSFADNGVDEPEEYSREAVERLVGKLPSEEDTAPEVDGRDANVIFLQLESFIDPKYFKDLGLESDPVSNFTAMKNSGPSRASPCQHGRRRHGEYGISGALRDESQPFRNCGIPLFNHT